MATFTTAELIESVEEQLRVIERKAPEEVTAADERAFDALSEELALLKSTPRAHWRLKEDL